MNPLARRDGLILRNLPDELVVYDTTRHEAHCLNAPAAFVFEHCDGRTSVAGLVRLLRREVDQQVDESWVRLALDQLSEAHLLEDPPETATAPSRRDVLRRLGWAAAAVPAVMTVLTPTPAEAAVTNCVANDACGGKPDGTPCESTPGDQCLGGNCCCGGTCGACTC